jgi:DSF synthase
MDAFIDPDALPRSDVEHFDTIKYAAPALPKSLSLGSYEDISVSIDPDSKTYWLAFARRDVPQFSLNMLRELNRSHRMIHQVVLDRPPGEPPPLKFFVACSDTPGVFSYGGDLSLFRRCIQTRDRSTLLAYANACVEAVYNNSFGFDVPVVSIGVIEGDALGGGFECALSFNVMIAERGVKMGLPESLFNSFPGMGAYSLLSRKVDSRLAERMILEGKLLSAEQLHELGIVNVLVDKGKGRDAAREYIRDNERRQSIMYAINKVRQRVNPVTLDELRDIAAIWVDTMMEFDEADLRRMDIVRSAQNRKKRRETLARAAAP